MNYNDWVQKFEGRTPEHLRGIIDAIDTMEKDADINREFDDLGIFAGFSIRGAAKEALKKKECQFMRMTAQRVYTMAVARIAEEYQQVNPAVITCPVTFRKVQEWVKEIKSSDSILDVAGAIIDTVIDDTHLYYRNLASKFADGAGLDGVNESECSILYGETYYSLEDDIVNILIAAYELESMGTVGDDEARTTPYFWDCGCQTRFIHPKDQRVCFGCSTAASDQPDSRISEVVSAKLGEVI